MKKILNVVGARPQIIKAAALSRAIRNNFKEKINDIIVHTGQHYDYNMSDIFFDELEIPKPHINMNTGSGTHAAQTAHIMIKTEEILNEQKPDFVVVYGDTNSTLAVAITAAKMHYPVVHIEAGLRSFNKLMPEEINRITCDFVSTLLFVPTQTALNNLQREGFNLQTTKPYHINNPAIFFSGDIMLDNALYFKSKAKMPSPCNKINDNFAIVTIHREQNTDNVDNLKSIIQSLIQIALKHKLHIIFPVHPRTTKILSHQLTNLKQEIDTISFFHLIEPVSYLEMLALLQNCKLVLTDSGGLQKEAYFFQKPCVILRPETEWIEIVEHGAGIITNIDNNKIHEAVNHFLNSECKLNFPPLFGNGKAAEFICKKLVDF